MIQYRPGLKQSTRNLLKIAFYSLHSSALLRRISSPTHTSHRAEKEELLYAAETISILSTALNCRWKAISSVPAYHTDKPHKLQEQWWNKEPGSGNAVSTDSDHTHKCLNKENTKFPKINILSNTERYTEWTRAQKPSCSPNYSTESLSPVRTSVQIL